MGRTAGGTIGHIRGAQIGSMSRELEQTASTSPFMQTHWQPARAGAATQTATKAAVAAMPMSRSRLIMVPCLWRVES